MAYVLISTDKNSQLHDQSNREGLIEGLALDAPGVFDPCIRTFVKLASGASRLYAEIDCPACLLRLCAYEDANELFLNNVSTDLLTLSHTHLSPSLRAKELDAWHRDGYRHLMGPEGFLNA